MVKKREAVQQAIHAALDSWDWRPPSSRESFGDLARAAPTVSKIVQTELSSTLFSGEPEEWVRYLRMTREQRYEPGLEVHAHLHPELRVIAVDPVNEDSEWLAELLDRGVRLLRDRLDDKPQVRRALDELIFENASNRDAELHVHLSPELPSDGTRETSTRSSDVRLVLHSRLSRYVRESIAANRGLSDDERLGLCWPLISRLVAVIAYPTAPRDRFASKIDVFAKHIYVTINVLYAARRAGQLVPSTVGAVYEHMVSESSTIPRGQLAEQHPYFRLLARLSFLLRGAPFPSYAEDVRIAAREYLDTVYLRPSLAGAMPPVAPAMRSMTFERKGHKIKTSAPEVGSYGILDIQDLDAWKAVVGPFRDLGFTLLRQLGIGEFGRVYEALNNDNRQFPARVALKIDRIVGKKKRAILEAEEAMAVGQDLARAPHLIRLYDTGKLRGQRFTYHVLQLIDGETLDNLVDITGAEHASVSRPPGARDSEREGEAEYTRAVSSRGTEAWRRQRLASPFNYALSSALLLDLLTSVLLWLESVHRIGYAINDLKNGNLMLSRRGQLKGIDLDSYAPVHTSKDKVTDFMFLAVSLVLLTVSASIPGLGRNLATEQLLESETRLRSALEQIWPFGDVEALSQGRVRREELTSVLVDLVLRSRHLVYAKRYDLFSEDIARLTNLKHRLLLEEMVID
jgi:hypothetical protein